MPNAMRHVREEAINEPEGADQAKVVLVVEDDPDHRKITATILMHHGYAVLEAADGGEGINLATARQPDLILMDARLPGLDGWTVTWHLKEDARTAHIPVIMFTAHVLATARLRSQKSGADGYLPKPCPPTEIVEEVRRWLGPTSGAAASRPVR